MMAGIFCEVPEARSLTQVRHCISLTLPWDSKKVAQWYFFRHNSPRKQREPKIYIDAN